jgi:hypothetical protein
MFLPRAKLYTVMRLLIHDPRRTTCHRTTNLARESTSNTPNIEHEPDSPEAREMREKEKRL